MMIENPTAVHALYWDRPSRRVRGAGLGELVDVTAIETEDNLLGVPLALARATFDDFMRRCRDAVRHGLRVKQGVAVATGCRDFQRAVRFTSLVTRSTGDVRLRTSYVYPAGSPANSEPPISLVGETASGTLMMTRRKELNLPEAIMMALPFPGHVFDMDPAVVDCLVRLSKGKRSYGLIGFGKLGNYESVHVGQNDDIDRHNPKRPLSL